MQRIACLRIPRFPIVVHRKQEPALKNKPLVLIPAKRRAESSRVSFGNASSFSRVNILVCSDEASKKGVCPGMKLSEARATCAEVVWREFDQRLYDQAQAELVRVFISCSPRVVARETGVFLLDAQGRQRLGGESKLCRDLLKLASRAGYVNGHVGIADSAFAALVATRFKNRRWFVVYSGNDQKFLAALPVEHLPGSQDLHDLLHDLGLNTMGQFAQLPVEQIIDRFGEEGKRAHELASGFDLSQPRVPVPGKRWECMVDLGGPIDALNQTMFVIKAMLDQLTAQLKEEGLRAEELTVSFFNEDDKFDERPIRLIQSANSAKFLLEVVRLSLEAQPLKREFTGLKIAVSRHCHELWEQPSIARLAQEKEYGEMQPESMHLLWQRFVTRLGEDVLVKPMANDQYLAEKAGVWQSVMRLQSPSALPSTDESARQRVDSETITASTAIDADYIKSMTGEQGLVANLVFKKHSPAVPVLVEFKDSQPSALRYHGRWHYIKRLTAPECISGNWWEDPMRRSYYTALIDVKAEPLEELEQPALLSLFHEHYSKTWFVDGVYD
jgi:nucleotidyltransferase/DNA polymerase involved in DNA repair